MPRVFLSHKHEEKSLVMGVRDFLERSLIKTWIDEKEIPGGTRLFSSILAGLTGSGYCLAFISERYLRSAYCMAELRTAHRHMMSKKMVLVPILIQDYADLKIPELPEDDRLFIKDLLEQITYRKYDKYDVGASYLDIAKMGIWCHEDIRFDPVEVRTVAGQPMQWIAFTLSGVTIPGGALKKLDLNIEQDFIARHPTEKKPITVNVPVCLSGAGPNWLYVNLAVQFKNLCSVWVYNNKTSEYLCAYDKEGSRVGDAVKA